MFPPNCKKETQAFSGIVGFCRMLVPNYSLILSPLCQVIWKNNQKWGLEQPQAIEQIKQEILHAVALGPVQEGQGIKNVLYTASGENGSTWSLWQKELGETHGQPLGFWRQDTEDQRQRYWHTKGFEQLWKWLVLKHCFSWHFNC